MIFKLDNDKLKAWQCEASGHSLGFSFEAENAQQDLILGLLQEFQDFTANVSAAKTAEKDN